MARQPHPQPPRDGTLARLVADGIRGVTANPTIFTNAIVGSVDYDEQFAALAEAEWSLEDTYWQLVVDDITAALAVLRPVFDAGGRDGFVSVRRGDRRDGNWRSVVPHQE